MPSTAEFTFDPARRRTRTTGAPGISFAPTPTATPAADASTNGNDPFAQFSDPSTHFLEQIIQQQLGHLSGPVHDPTRDGIMAFLGKQLGTMSSAPPITFDAPGDFSVDNPLLNDFIASGRQRITELNQRPFTDAEEAALRTRTRNDTLVTRDAAKQHVLEDAARRGLGESSGVIQAGLQGQEQAFTSADAKNQNDLMLWIADQIQQRKDKATGISQQLAGAGEQQAARVQAGRTAAGQLKMQGQIAATSANQARQGQVMGIAGALAEMAAQARGETRAREGDVLSLSTLLSQLPIQRLQTLMGVLNGSGGNNIQDLFGNVATLNNAQQNATNTHNAQSASFLNGLSSLASYYANRGKK